MKYLILSYLLVAVNLSAEDTIEDLAMSEAAESAEAAAEMVTPIKVDLSDAVDTVKESVTDVVEEVSEIVAEEPVLIVLPPAPTDTADEGIHIQVESSGSNSGNTELDGQDVVITSPWPAKPQPAPANWEYTPAPESLPDYKTSINLGSGKSVDLAITPFVLIPSQDGVSSIRIMEPGYRSEQGVQQTDTVGSLLLSTTLELTEKEKQASEAISKLQQLLSSLPKSQ